MSLWRDPSVDAKKKEELGGVERAHGGGPRRRPLGLAGGVVYKIAGGDTGGSFSVVEHPMEPGTLAALPHTHTNEDEYSFVLERGVGVLIGEDEYRATPGTYVLKPRGIVHTFWNPGPRSTRILEIISPAGFEGYFEEMAEVISAAAVGAPDLEKMGEIAEKYGLSLHPERLQEIVEKHGVELR